MRTVTLARMGEGRTVRLTPAVMEQLRDDEALVFDWHTIAICCAAAGDVSLRRTTRAEAERSRSFVRMPGEGSAPVYAHRRAYPHLAGRAITVDCRRSLGMRRFTSDLPADFGLRSVFGRLPAPNS